MDRRMAQVQNKNQDKGKAPQIPSEEEDQAWAQAPDQNQDKGKAPQVPHDQDEDLDWDQVLGEDEFFDDDEDEDDDDDEHDQEDEEQALAADQAQNQDHQVQLEPPQVPNEEQDAVPRRNTGRRKIDDKKIGNQAHLQVTFSKRRTGLFKKANELVILTAAELALIVFSPGNKPYSFGHPSLDDIIDRFLSRTAVPADPTTNLVLAQQSENVRQLNDQLKRMQAELEEVRQKKVAFDHARAVSRLQRSWEAPIEEQSREQLVVLRSAMVNLQANLARYIEMRTQQEQQNPPSAFHPGPGASSLDGSTAYGGGVGGANVNFQSFSPGSRSYGDAGGGFSQFAGGSNAFGGGFGGVEPAFPTGLNYFGGDFVGAFGHGGANPYPQPSAQCPFGYGLSSGGHLPVATSPSGRGGGGAWGMGSNLSDFGSVGDLSMGPNPSGRGGPSHVGPIFSHHGGGGASYVGPYGRGGRRGRGPRPGYGRGRGSSHGQGFQ